MRERSTKSRIGEESERVFFADFFAPTIQGKVEPRDASVSGR
jgi:hypothetical protein